jgi:para-nitrobenzyl esterase
LLSLSAENLLAAQGAASLALIQERGLASVNGGLAFQPVIGGSAVPRPPLEHVRAGGAADVRLIAGTTSEEWKLFALLLRGAGPLDRDGLVARCRAAVGEVGEAIAEGYLRGSEGMSTDEVWSAIATDAIFRVPAVRLADAQAAHQPDTFMYEFDHRSTAWGGVLGACHAIEIPFVFDNLHKRGIDAFLGEVGEAERGLATETSSAWLAFAKGEAPWDNYDASRRATRRLGGASPGIHDDPRADDLALWDGVL